MRPVIVITVKVSPPARINTLTSQPLSIDPRQGNLSSANSHRLLVAMEEEEEEEEDIPHIVTVRVTAIALEGHCNQRHHSLYNSISI